MLYGLSLLTGTSYNDVSVAINIFAEPILCLLMMVPALLSMLSKERAAKVAFDVFKYTVLGLVVTGVISLIYGGIWFLRHMDQLQDFSFSEIFGYSPSQLMAFAKQVEALFPAGMYTQNEIFTYIEDNLIYLSRQLGMTYEAINIIIYVIAELLSIGMFYLTYRLKKSKPLYFILGILFFIISVIPTLYLIHDTL